MYLKHTVALVEDHSLLRHLLKKAINNLPGFEVIVEATNGTEFKEILRSSLLPDIAIVDLCMPNGNGFEVLEWITRDYQKVKVVILSMKTDELTVIKAFKAGAKGYLFKTMEYELLQSKLKQLLCGELVFPNEMYEILLARSELEPPQLTKTEINFINCLASEMSYKEISENLYVSPRTLEDYKSALCRKLKVKSRVGLVVTGIKYGIVLIDQMG
jgi:two-component system, NarL family, invasion response regulator UvrY